MECLRHKAKPSPRNGRELELKSLRAEAPGWQHYGSSVVGMKGGKVLSQIQYHLKVDQGFLTICAFGLG